MTGPDNDSEFEDFLARRSPLHRRLADGDGHEPSTELDRIVLAKAREAIRRPSETPVYRSPQWAMPVGLAASVLLIFAVVLNFARVTRQPGMASAPMAANAPTTAPVTANERARRAEEGESAAPLADSKAEADAAPAAALASRDSLLAKEAAPPLVSTTSSAKRSTSSAGTSIATAEPSEIRDLTAGGSILARSSTAGAAAAGSVGPPAAPAVAQAAPPAESSETSNSPLMAANAAEAAASDVAASDQSARSDESKKIYTASNTASPAAGATIGALEEVTTVGARRVRGGTKRPATASTPAAVAAEKARHPDADAWLREIEAIRAAGRAADARRELEAFRKTYPDHPVPLSKDEPPPAE